MYLRFPLLPIVPHEMRSTSTRAKCDTTQQEHSYSICLARISQILSQREGSSSEMGKVRILD